MTFIVSLTDVLGLIGLSILSAFVFMYLENRNFKRYLKYEEKVNQKRFNTLKHHEVKPVKEKLLETTLN